ncbi:hypothetical protein GWK47_009464 [Chionoecetes opilio]|uniref:Uncharacterized protein n=1 Tax=Chionoecetes opilio TaxID=41210 RepID=A0A8J5CNK8_CHIOP|nr:hypothetical protein GWK47_009464 [Chionoecetes opilio]
MLELMESSSGGGRGGGGLGSGGKGARIAARLSGSSTPPSRSSPNHSREGSPLLLKRVLHPPLAGQLSAPPVQQYHERLHATLKRSNSLKRLLKLPIFGGQSARGYSDGVCGGVDEGLGVGDRWAARGGRVTATGESGIDGRDGRNSPYPSSGATPPPWRQYARRPPPLLSLDSHFTCGASDLRKKGVGACGDGYITLACGEAIVTQGAAGHLERSQGHGIDTGPVTSAAPFPRRGRALSCGCHHMSTSHISVAGEDINNLTSPGNLHCYLFAASPPPPRCPTHPRPTKTPGLPEVF